jgi:hypothetical protein
MGLSEGIDEEEEVEHAAKELNEGDDLGGQQGIGEEAAEEQHEAERCN